MSDFAREYGEGLYALCADENIADEVLAQLGELKKCFDEQPDFCRILSNMSMSKAERVHILDVALRNKINIYLLNFLKILCERGAISEFSHCEEVFRKCYNDYHDIIEAKVLTGVPLDNTQRNRIIEKLKKISGKDIVLLEEVDPTVIGGVSLEMNGERYDDTIRHRLDAIKKIMMDGEESHI